MLLVLLLAASDFGVGDLWGGAIITPVALVGLFITQVIRVGKTVDRDKEEARAAANAELAAVREAAATALAAANQRTKDAEDRAEREASRARDAEARAEKAYDRERATLGEVLPLMATGNRIFDKMLDIPAGRSGP